MDEEQQQPQLQEQPTSKPTFDIDKSQARYELSSFIVHLGTSTHTGHYVAYVKKDGNWIQYNDRLVLKSEHPPVGGAYMLFFRRI